MKTVLLFILYLKSGLIGAVYKQWIPDTNFDNATNWDKARVPCFKDKIYFDSRMSVSVYVQSTHLLTEMHIPLDGEFIFVPDSGFAASTGSDDPNCHKGENLNFISPDQNAWYDPKMWHAAASIDDLEKNKYLFTVDEERVPCQYDNVIFRPETSFRVNVDSAEKEISVSTISVLGKKFSSNDDFSQYMQSNTAKLQFHGKGTIKVTNTKCSDKSGCECGNTANFDRICSALNQHTGNKCPKVSCKNPLTPVGHCCGVCGATISLKYSSEFDLERYRDRLIHTFLSLGKYAGVQMGISKVSRQQTLLGFIPRETVSEVQIVLIDEKTGSQAGITAAQLAKDIMNDIQEHGNLFIMPIY
ncbi:protein amnionless [Protopterus annectens]|uniref:protein amnionless n=1 Tax=Protopterus annectens TaxID=7888 RepID=UPI001CF95D92|nr:protein amnionless [Protopterus annectens]